MALIVLGTLATGCSSYAVAKYGVSVENVSTLRALGDEKINVGAFGAAKPGQTAIMCRAVGPVRTPDGGPFEEYIRKALIDELRVAGAFSDAASVTLTGHLGPARFPPVPGHRSPQSRLSRRPPGRNLLILGRFAAGTRIALQGGGGQQ
jgi:hypothetical protein